MKRVTFLVIRRPIKIFAALNSNKNHNAKPPSFARIGWTADWPRLKSNKGQ